MTFVRILVAALLACGWPAPVQATAQAQTHAQHESPRPAPEGEGEASLAQCAQVQPVIQSLIDVAALRLEAARQANSGPALRAAVDDVSAALRDLRAQLAPCAATQVIDPHTGHIMPVLPAPAPGKPPKSPHDHSAPAGVEPPPPVSPVRPPVPGAEGAHVPPRPVRR